MTQTDFRRSLLAFLDLPSAARPTPSASPLNDLDVRCWGAVFDDQSRPVAAHFGSLDAAKKTLPLVSLTGNEELDFACIVQAVETARRRGGGTVLLPAGTGRMNNGKRPEATVVLPECRPFGDRGVQVNIKGEGKYATILHWPYDAGAGKFALSCGDPIATRANEKGRYGTSSSMDAVGMDWTQAPVSWAFSRSAH